MATIFTFWTFLLSSWVIMSGSSGQIFAFLTVMHYLCSHFKTIDYGTQVPTVRKIIDGITRRGVDTRQSSRVPTVLGRVPLPGRPTRRS